MGSGVTWARGGVLLCSRCHDHNNTVITIRNQPVSYRRFCAVTDSHPGYPTTLIDSNPQGPGESDDLLLVTVGASKSAKQARDLSVSSPSRSRAFKNEVRLNTGDRRRLPSRRG